jgi:hypothetical protein
MCFLVVVLGKDLDIGGGGGLSYVVAMGVEICGAGNNAYCPFLSLLCSEVAVMGVSVVDM